MKVREIMTANPMAASPNDSIQRVCQMFAECDVGAIPIVSMDRLVGIVTDRDICTRAYARGATMDSPVEQFMTAEPQACSPDTDMNDCANLMADLQVRRIPVVSDNNRLVGIITLGDMAAKLEDPQMCGNLLIEISRPIGPKCQLEAA